MLTPPFQKSPSNLAVARPVRLPNRSAFLNRRIYLHLVVPQSGTFSHRQIIPQIYLLTWSRS